MEPRAGLEPATCRLRIGCSTTELPRLCVDSTIVNFTETLSGLHDRCVLLTSRSRLPAIRSRSPRTHVHGQPHMLSWRIADLHQSRRSYALLMDDRRTTGNDRFFRYSVEITRPTLHVGSGLVQFVPVHLGKGKPRVWFDRFCFHLFHTDLHLSQGIEALCSRPGHCGPFRTINSGAAAPSRS